MRAVKKPKRELLIPKSVAFPPGLWQRAKVRAQAQHRSVSSYLRILVDRDLASAEAEERRAS